MGGAESLVAARPGPVVMVLASPEADALCLGANGLTLAELLRPFGALRGLAGGVGVPVRTVAERPLRLHDLTLRFHAGPTMFQPPPEAAEAHLDAVLAAAAAAPAAGAALPLAEVARAGGAEAAAPWFAEYRREYLRMLRFGEHEAVDHPVAAVLALRADFEGDAAAAFAELADVDAPPLMKRGVMEPRVPRVHVLLHDAAGGEGALAAARERAAALAPALGSVRVLAVNSGGAGNAAPPDPALWAAALRPPVPGGGAGERAERPPPPAGRGLAAALSPADVAALAEFASDLAVRGVVPAMEARVRALDAHVGAARRGLRNQLRSFLSRGARGGGDGGEAAGAAAAAAAAAGAPYPHASVEAAMRQLGDLAAALGDAETSASALRLLAADAKADKAWAACAAAHEGLAAAAAAAGPAGAADVVAHLREAHARYGQVAGGGGARHAARAALGLASHLAAAGRAADAALVYLKAHYAEGAARAALLLEAAAHASLGGAPPARRRAAFHLVLAGLRYRRAGQPRLARRAYAQVEALYCGTRAGEPLPAGEREGEGVAGAGAEGGAEDAPGGGWALIREHVHVELGRQATEAGDAAAAAAHARAALACCGRAPAREQRAALDALAAALAAGAAPAPGRLPLPAVDAARVGLTYAGQVGFANLAARGVPAEAWRPLEAALAPAAEAGPTWMDGGARAGAAAAAAAAAGSCCAGEDVGVDVAISNPLQIDLALARLRLVCALEPAAGAAAPAPGGPPPLQVREEALTLRGGEAMVVHLRVKPLRPGRLVVSGVAWTLDGGVEGERAFAIPRPRPRKPGSARPLVCAPRAPPGGVELAVLPPMPRLAAAFEGLPPSALAGQVVRGAVRLRNEGTMSLHNLAVAAGAGVFFGAPPGGGPRPAAARAPGGAAVFALPPGTKLGVAAELVLPVWFRAGAPGPATLAAVFRFEPVVRMEAFKYRLLRAAAPPLPVLPSLEARAAALAGAAVPARPLLQLRLLNLQGAAAFRTARLRAARPRGGGGEGWRLAPLGTGAAAAAAPAEEAHLGGARVDPEAAVTLHFHLTPPGTGAAAAPAPAVLANGPAAEGGGDDDDAAAMEFLLDGARPRRLAAPAAARQAGGAGAAPAAPAPQPEGPLSRPLDLALFWDAEMDGAGGACSGFHVLLGVVAAEGPPLRAQLVAPPAVAHDFGARPLCPLDVRLRLQSVLPAPTRVVVEAGRRLGGADAPPGDATWVVADEPDGSGAPPGLVAAARPAGAHTWCGRTRVTLPAMQPGEVVEVPLTVAVSCPGRLVLDDVALHWSCEGGAGAPRVGGSLPGPASNAVDVRQVDAPPALVRE